MRVPIVTRQAKRLHDCSSHRVVDTVTLFLLSRHHFTAPPSPKRYGNRYEVEGRTNFLERRQREVRAENCTGGYSSTNSSTGTPYALAIFVTVGM